MAQYINKDVLVAEIDRRIKELREVIAELGNHAGYECGAVHDIYLYKYIHSFIDTLEVKEVDLEEELDEWMKYGPHTSYPWCTIPDAIKITAEYFFELGFKAQSHE